MKIEMCIVDIGTLCSLNAQIHPISSHNDMSWKKEMFYGLSGKPSPPGEGGIHQDYC
jgi:hypothetical protein